MKKILIIVIIITLPIIAYFQYATWKRYNPPSDFAYPLKDDIDVNYYNADWVKEYYANAVELARFAREKYSNEGFDVQFPENTNVDQLNASKYYHNLIARNMFIEKQLQYGMQLKQMGLNNSDIQRVIETGINPEFLEVYNNKSTYLLLRLGDVGPEVWQVQKTLLSQGFELPLDGTFGVETGRQLQAFQSKNSIFPSGVLDEETFLTLFK